MKNIQEVGEQMTSKMIDALYVSVKSNADIIVNHIVTSVGKSIEKDEMPKHGTCYHIAGITSVFNRYR